MKTPLERARAKHSELVKQHSRFHDRYDGFIDKAFRAKISMQKAERAIARSQKRMDKLLAAAVHTNGPTASPLPAVIEKQAAPVRQAPTPLNDPLGDVPAFLRRPQPSDQAVQEDKPTPAKRKRRRTPDDFVADKKRKAIDQLA